MVNSRWKGRRVRVVIMRYFIAIAVTFLVCMASTAPFTHSPIRPFANFTVAHAESRTPAVIIPYDAVTFPGIEIWPQAKVIAKRFFAIDRPVPGERIEFIGEDRYLGLALTGGDGIGAVRYIPSGEGIQKIRIRLAPPSAYEAKEAEMLIGVWSRSKPLLLVSVESLRERPKEVIFPFIGRIKRDAERHPLDYSVDILSEISREINIVYLYNGDVAHLPAIRSWLSRNGFPVYPVFLWDSSKAGINKLISERKKEIKGVIITQEDDVFIFQKENIRVLLMTEKENRESGTGAMEEIEGAIIISDWRDVKNNIE